MENEKTQKWRTKPPSKIDYGGGYVLRNAKFLCICVSYNFDSSNEIKNVSTIFLKILFSFAFLIWIADLKVHLRSAYGRDIHIEYFWRQFVSWKYLLHHNYSTIVEKMGWNTKCWHQLLAVLSCLNSFHWQ